MKEKIYKLHPMLIVEKLNNKYLIRNILYKNSIEINDISELFPNNHTIANKIFFDCNELDDIKLEMFKFLEKLYNTSPTKIGYIETTVKCLYKCKMCPKYNNKIIRKHNQMSIDKFKTIAKQINNQNTITLHLFGDPLLDTEIFDKIKIINDNGIKASFSTNIPSIFQVDLNELKKVKLKSLILSIDYLEHEKYVKTRGIIEKNLLDNLFIQLSHILDLNKGQEIFEKLILQIISLEGNEETYLMLKKYAQEHEDCVLYEKKYIEFPNTNVINSAKIEYENYLDKEFIYKLLNKPLPFKCLKPWNKKESAINTDGDYLPCCMSYNNTLDLGNINHSSIENIQSNKRNFEFRKSIFNNDCDINTLCYSCNNNISKSYSNHFTKEEKYVLSKYCIEKW